MFTLVLLRHGESEWNRENRFTGWQDIDLSDEGAQQARRAGSRLLEQGLKMNVAFTSVLKRAIKTFHIAAETADQLWIPEIKAWQLNERHYGELEGLNKQTTAEKYSAEKVFSWRRSFTDTPPVMQADDKRSPLKDEKYAGIAPALLPLGESLQQMMHNRILPYWTAEIAPKILEGYKIIISSHGNTLRGLVKHLDKISDQDIENFDIPTGVPLVYELDKELRPIKHYYLK